MLKIVPFISMLLLLSPCKSNNIPQLVAELVRQERPDEVKLYQELNRYGKESIPYLIDVLDKDDKGLVGFVANDSSVNRDLVNINYVGIRAAYIIELILANPNHFRIYEYGIIFRKKEDKPVMAPLSQKNMLEVKAIYEKWWKSTQSKSLSELRNNWKNGDRALNNSNYTWN